MFLLKMKALPLTLALLAVSAVVFGQTKITAASLLKEMTDREALTRFPNPHYRLEQASSYDRLSVSKDQPGWFANADWNAFIREDMMDGRRELVMMDQEGPGAIVRFWMTFSGQDGGKGTLRIYVDDMKLPVIVGKAFDVLSGGMLAPAPLSDSVSELSPYERRGHNLYYPILFARRCKVTYESPNAFTGPDKASKKGSEHVYYNIGFRKYDPAVKMDSFSWKGLEKDRTLIGTTAALLGASHEEKWQDGKGLSRFEAGIAPGDSYSFLIRGEKEITGLRLSVEAKDRVQALRSTVMEICFDGQSTVWCPVGDFFGTGYMDVQTHTFMTDVANGVYQSFWVMPFQNECRIVFHNLGEQEVRIKDGAIRTVKKKWTDRSLYFGANWSFHSRYLTGDGCGHTNPRDVPFTRIAGKGVHVGDAVVLYDTSTGWWGEGDEKIYVDGETFPSSFGTGTEDYFGYAWCRPEVFTGHPFIAQPAGDGDLSVGYTVNSRYRALDRIPFQKSFDFDMEIWHWNESLLNYASTSFWYVSPDGACMMPRENGHAREKVALTRSDIIDPSLSLSLEGEDLSATKCTGGSVRTQSRTNGLWSRSSQLFWTDAAKGDELELCFHSPVAGKYRLLLWLTKAVDYGTVDIRFNGVEIARQMDLYAPDLTLVMADFGEMDLKEGENTLTLRFEKPGEGFQKCLLGIDRLMLTRQVLTTN